MEQQEESRLAVYCRTEYTGLSSLLDIRLNVYEELYPARSMKGSFKSYRFQCLPLHTHGHASRMKFRGTGTDIALLTVEVSRSCSFAR